AARNRAAEHGNLFSLILPPEPPQVAALNNYLDILAMTVIFTWLADMTRKWHLKSFILLWLAVIWSQELASATHIQTETRKQEEKVAGIKVTRLLDAPIIHPGLDFSIGENIQGPSVIRVPHWVDNPLGKYYLYFADHKGSYIRLAYADALIGPWTIYSPGTLQLSESLFLNTPPEVDATQREQIEAAFAKQGIKVAHDVVEEVTTPHIASPDVHVDHANQQIIMYYHGLEGLAHQVTRVATSANGIDFTAQPQVLGQTYFRVFSWKDHTYALAMPGQLYRSVSPFGPFEKGPRLFNSDMRHNAVLRQRDTLWVFWTQVGDVPEHIKVSTIALNGDWQSWTNSAPVEVLRPEKPWEGALAPLQPSIRSTAYGQVNQLRDPAIFIEDDRVYLFYAVAGESGIGLAELEFGSL
ncbi:MAG: hypothetical protein V2I41_11505, partial [Pseudomonadales bacterium]|nr:hypothetical protein [Pseudomonadales bacterium]